MRAARFPSARLLRCLVLGALALLLQALGCRGGSGDAALARLELIAGTVGTSPGRLRQPRAIAVDPTDGRFYVVDRTGRIQLFGADGGLLLWWRLPDSRFGQPVGLALEAGGTLLVNDSHYHRLLRYSARGELLASWGSEGKGPGQFTFGRDVAVDSAGSIYAGDYGGLNDRIQKFSPDGAFLLEWGRSGRGPGEFDRPQGMAIERRGDREFLLVADCSNHRVQRFDLEGRFVSSWGSLGTEPGCLRYPISVAVAADGGIYVCEWGNNRLQKFDGDGKPLGTWGRAGRREGELATPWDVAIGPEGRIYVVDYGNHRVQVLRWGGAQDGPRERAAAAPSRTAVAATKGAERS